MRTLAIFIILISMISCLKAPFLQEEPRHRVGVDKIEQIREKLGISEEPNLSIIKDIIADKLPGWEEPIEYTVRDTAGNLISHRATLLHIMVSCKYPYEEIEPLIKEWIEHGGDIQAKDAQDRVALHLAAMTVNTPIVKLLLGLDGVKDTIADSYGKLAIHYACERCEKGDDEGNTMYDIIRSLLQPWGFISVGSLISTDPSQTEHSLDDPDPLTIRRAKAKQDLLAYVNKLDNKGSSPLYYTSEAMCRSLKKLGKKAITDAQQAGLQRGYKQAEQCYLYLKNFRADANQEKIREKKLKILMLGKDLVSPQVTKPENYIKYFIEKVEKGESEEIARLTAIIQADTKINDEGHTILYWLIANGHREVTRMLVEKSEAAALGNSLAGDTSSCCPLYTAVSQGDSELSKLLIYGKAIQKYRGQLAAQVAADSVESEIVEARGGVITRSYADNAETLLDAACASGNLSVVQLILESMAICKEKYENEQNSPLPANQIMGEFRYLPSDTRRYAKAIREFIEQVRSVIEGTRKSLDKKAQSTTGISGGGGLSLFSFGGSVQGEKNMTVPSWDISREHAVSAARQGWRDKSKRIWEQKL